MTGRRLSREQLRERRLPLDRRDVVSLEIAHIDTLNEIARGRGTGQTMWDWVSNVLTWSRAADLMELGQDEMREQLALAHRLIERQQSSGRVAFDGPDLQLARHGVDVMDELARQVTRGQAMSAAHWSEQRLARLRPPEQRKAA